MAFARGDRVHLAGLGSGIVRELRGSDRYAVEIKGRVVIAAGRDLETAPPAGNARREATPPTPAPGTRATPAHTPTLDLHGHSVETAVAALAVFLNDALLSGHGEVRIIHGKGGGRVKRGVHDALRRLPVVAAVRLDPHNAGVTIVTFT